MATANRIDGIGGGALGSTGNVRVVRGKKTTPRPKSSVPKEKQKKGPTMRSTAKDKPLTAKEKTAGNKRGLKKATGKSLYPKNYGPDSVARTKIQESIPKPGKTQSRYDLVGRYEVSRKRAAADSASRYDMGTPEYKVPSNKTPKSNPRKPLLPRLKKKSK